LVDHARLFPFAGALAGFFLAPHQAEAATPIPIQHVIMIMQENRSFDHYFGTFPGANGFPASVCVPLNPALPNQGCVAPFHDQHDINAGGLHTAASAAADIDGSGAKPAFDGFVYQQTISGATSCTGSAKRPGSDVTRQGQPCTGNLAGIARHDVMGYHNADEISSYWAYAQHFVLQDQLYESVRSFSQAAHLYMTSEWSALCTNPALASTCTTSLAAAFTKGSKVVYPWANLFQLMDKNNVSWKYYLGTGKEPDCEDDEMTCAPAMQNNGILSIWNPAPGFASVVAQGPAYLSAHNPAMDQFLVDVKNGTLPQVSWIIPSEDFSEHPVAGVTAGMEYVTSLVNAVMQSPYWANSAIFISWDDWGGFYDHVLPPTVDVNTTAPLTPIQGYGLRVPGLLVSAWAKPGYIDHNVLSFDSYAAFIEDLFMDGARLNPAKLGNPDSRPTIRDALRSVTFPDGSTAAIGDLRNEFDFKQKALPSLVLSTHVPPSIQATCASANKDLPQACTISTVTVSWKSVSGAQVPGPFNYYVQRDGISLAGCSKLTKPICADEAVPSGPHYYRVYSVDSSNVASPLSAAAEADAP
jgi:phospholipase C